MRQFDIVTAKNLACELVLILQSDIFSAAGTVIVAPLVPVDSAPKPTLDANIKISLDGNIYLALIYRLAAVSKKDCGETVISIANRRDEIIAVIDRIFVGF